MSSTERLVLDLPSEVVATVREAVQRGDFNSESEAVSAILKVWHDDGVLDEGIGALHEIIAEGLAEVDAGKVFDADEVHSELRGQIKTIADRRK
ncbi:MAG TPA: hypothetical protein VEK75_03510 [Xanthobacteraceae bacterium]|nr:hypothetical protein [Xanthobacteraceae bacterium]